MMVFGGCTHDDLRLGLLRADPKTVSPSVTQLRRSVSGEQLADETGLLATRLAKLNITSSGIIVYDQKSQEPFRCLHG